MQQTSKKLEIEPLPAMPMEAAAHDNEVPSPRPESGNARKVLRSFGLGIITGAADDDPSAVGTYASAGAKFGPSFLWVAPMMFPMMFAVVYLAGKLGQVSGHGLFAVLRANYPRWLLYAVLIGVLMGNIFEAGADIAGMSAAAGLLVPVPAPMIVAIISAAVLALQVWGSYKLIRDIFRWLALALLAYAGSALLAKPDWNAVIRATFIPAVRFDREFLAMLVAVIGASLSAYIYTWQSNEEVEEKVEAGQRKPDQRRGTTSKQLDRSARDIIVGMLFSNLVMFFIILAAGSTLFRAGQRDVETAAQAAQALGPLAGRAASILFALGMIGVGFLAIPVMTTGAAYDVAQTLGWKNGLYRKPKEAKAFYAAICAFTGIAAALNFSGISPMKFLVWAGIVQGFSTPPLMLLIMLMTNNRQIMGTHRNSRPMNVLGWLTTAAIFAASLGLAASYAIR